MNRTFALSCAGLSLLLTACDPKPTPVPPPKGDAQVIKAPKGEELHRKRLERGMESPFVFSPQAIEQPEQRALLFDLYAGLVRLNSQGEIESALASHWEQTSPTVWRFHLREGAKWSNGESLTAQDFVRSWWQLALSDSPLREYLRYLHLLNTDEVLAKKIGVESLGVQALDDRTLVFTLSEPVPFLPKLLAHVALLPVYAHNDGETLISNGAYRLKSHNSETALLEKNADYFDAAKVAFEQVRYHHDLTGALDITPNTTQSAVAPSHVLLLPQLCNYYYEFNFRHPRLQQRAVRQAIDAMVAQNDLLPQSAVGFRLNTKFLPHNLQTQAQSQGWSVVVPEQQLAQAGVSREKPLKLRLTYDNTGIHPAVAQQLVRMLSQSDLIYIQPEMVTTEELLARRNRGDFDLIRSGWCADFYDPAAFFDPLYSHSPNNKMGINDPDIDGVLNAIYQPNVSQSERSALYDKLARVVDDKQIVLPLFQAYRTLRINDSVQGVSVNFRLGYLPSEGLYRKVSH
ncbi:peptide ABC transporter substrate-binding protein [Pasteurellaceae bacterium HPA106]|uniref:peptide ABC transporter substrate-binding protein n=1 Tax=Spirabiliibacterium pneumoniae TaxID=221400 RepID=UPI001AAD7260|nr:peptide ABC transporter substrate-binding protein [Spirabiliibacterium pneumoniae]MBE2895327.1 peptide ABC transporter substrate-binding protein [Spirabiliibacterium pneumoniae]